MKLTAVAFAVKPSRYSPKLTLALAAFSWEHRGPGLGSAQCGPGWLRQQRVSSGRGGPDDCSAHIGTAGRQLSQLSTRSRILVLRAALSDPRASSIEQFSDSDLKT